MIMSVEQSVERQLGGENEVVGENLPQCHIVHHKSHVIRRELEPGLGRLSALRAGRPPFPPPPPVRVLVLVPVRG
jgi:hypothetical protein